MQRTVVLFAFVAGCTGEEPVLSSTNDAGSSGSSGTSGSSGGTGEKLAFVTEAQFDGKFGLAAGGLAAADKICNDEARVAGRSGDFRALLCINGTSGVGRLSQGPWRLQDGALVPTRTELISLGNVNINRSAAGRPQSGKAWTGCDDLGQPHPDNCQNWANGTDAANGHAGLIGGPNGTWIANESTGCQEVRHLYCLEN